MSSNTYFNFKDLYIKITIQSILYKVLAFHFYIKNVYLVRLLQFKDKSLYYFQATFKSSSKI